ncbi:MAG: hypothetical protein ABIE42_10080 [Candidatus Eisenbacteria bacterium]
MLEEHLLLGSLAFPLTLKLDLAEHGHYSLTDDDWFWVDLFESLACTEYLRTGAQLHNAGEDLWQGIVERARWQWAEVKAMEDSELVLEENGELHT